MSEDHRSKHWRDEPRTFTAEIPFQRNKRRPGLSIGDGLAAGGFVLAITLGIAHVIGTIKSAGIERDAQLEKTRIETAASAEKQKLEIKAQQEKDAMDYLQRPATLSASGEPQKPTEREQLLRTRAAKKVNGSKDDEIPLTITEMPGHQR